MMNRGSKQIIIKLVHIAIWIFFNLVIFYMAYAIIIANKIDKWVWICIGLIVLEGLTLLVFKRMCPVTLIARKYSDSNKDNFDIYLPNWLAKYNKTIYTSIFLVLIIILLYRITIE